ncbi:hypothetical protein IKW75_02170 [Candidatus Saccharibacteria bacterium]|nr:hypothetical protein [Candidatus Saccharibacteria bacterium]
MRSNKKATQNVYYHHLAKELMLKIANHELKDMSIIMDSNPTLYKNLIKQKKNFQIKGLRIKEGSSEKQPNLQLVDYIVNICYRSAKRLTNSDNDYKIIARQAIEFDLKEI